MQISQHLLFPGDTPSPEGTPETPSTDDGKSEVVLVQGGSIHKVNISGANKRMLHLLKRAKVQLIKIDQQKQMKTAQVRICVSRFLPGSPSHYGVRCARFISFILCFVVVFLVQGCS